MKPFISDYSSHQEHLSTLTESYSSLVSLSKSINPGESNRVKYLIKKVQCDYLMKTLEDINKSIIYGLNNKLYTVCEALSRIAIEYAINMMFILEGENHERSKSLLKHYITKSKEKAKKWLNYSERVNDIKGIKHANSKLNYLNDLARENKDLVGKGVKGWKDARQRFSDVGHEHMYHILFSSASDSVHSASEDIFNLTMTESLPATMRETAHHGIYAEKVSFAYYLSANALLFFAESLARLAAVMEENEVENEIICIGKELSGIIQSHQDVTDLYERS
jgi:hypothetical protein